MHNEPIQNMATSVKSFLVKLIQRNELQIGERVHKQGIVTDSISGIFDFDVLTKNLKKLESIYLGNSNSFDERYFVLQHEKLKTPLKMSPFGARAGPM